MKIIEMIKKNHLKTQSLKIPKPILLSAKLLETISPKLVTIFAAKLFTTPLKHKIPKREWHMVSKSDKQKIWVPHIKKEIQLYCYGTGTKKILVVHGWSGRGTQLVQIADGLLHEGYKVISFDAPAHGKSQGKKTIMSEFIATILEIDKLHGPFEFAIGHSLGGMAILNAIKQNLNLKKAVIISSGDLIQDILDDFILKLKLRPQISQMMRRYFEKKYGEPVENYAASAAAKSVKIPVLIIHDENDTDVNVKAAYNIQKNLVTCELLITTDLGHRKILGDAIVLEKIKEFIEN